MRRCAGQGRGWPSQICRRSPDPCPVRPGPSSVPGLRVLFLKAQIQIQIQTRTCPLTPNRNFVSKSAGCALPLLSYPIPNSALGSSASTTARGRFVCFPATQALSSDLAHSTLHVAVSLGFVFPAKKKNARLRASPKSFVGLQHRTPQPLHRRVPVTRCLVTAETRHEGSVEELISSHPSASGVFLRCLPHTSLLALF